MAMDMWNAPSDRDYAEYLNPQEPDEDPDNTLPPAQPQELPDAECTF